MNLSAPVATLLAASIAAVASVIVLVLRISSGASAETRQAFRDELRPYVQEIGDTLYMIVSCAVLYCRDEDTANRRHWNKRLELASRRLRKARSRVRYQLWGLDEAFRAMIFLAIWIRQVEPDRRAHLIQAATRLRHSLDRTTMHCYLRGRPPSLLERASVELRLRQLMRLGRAISDADDVEMSEAGGLRRPQTQYPKIVGTITKREGDNLTVTSEDGMTYSVSVWHRSGKRSRADAQPGAKVKLYQRPWEDFYRFRFSGG